MNNQNNFQAAFAYAINFHMQVEIGTDVLLEATADNLDYLVREFSDMYADELPGGIDADTIKRGWLYWAEYNKITCADAGCDYEALITAIKAL